MKDAPSWDVSEIARTGSVETLRNHSLEQKIEELRKRRCPFRHRLHERDRELASPFHVHSRLAGQGFDVFDNPVHRLPDQISHGFGGKLQLIVVHDSSSL